MSRAHLPLSYRVDERQIGGETLHLDAGDSVFVLTSCIADLGLELRNAYLAVERIDRVLVSESAVLGGSPTQLRSRWLLEAEDVLYEQRRRLLYDHLQALQDLAAGGGWQLRVEGVEAAAVVLDPHAPISATST